MTRVKICGITRPEDADLSNPSAQLGGTERRGEETATQGADEGSPIHHSIT